ncbi:MAG: radical SAM family heme chaperone HemW [Muribaculaceae bacterium]|nr:radical SAM family heme chaperone HemW [Muribaculaceae bacterium]
MAGIYIHIPFCKRKCSYCDFYSLACSLQVMDHYVAAVVKEARLRSGELKNAVNTLYVGGGTPSLLSTDHLRTLIDGLSNVFNLSKLQEFTIEVNPDDVTSETMSVYQSLSVNRVSMGVQSFDEKDLHFINRRHSSQQAIETVEIIRNSGVNNVSIDLIYGIPGQTLDTWMHNVQQAIALGVQHISAYCLSYEEGTPLWHMRERGEVQEVDEETTVRMYEVLVEHLCKAGYLHYEISNFALPGFESKHNSSYWDGTPYLGLGAAAHSYDGGAVRSYNPADIDGYMKCLDQDMLPCEREQLNTLEQYDEMVMLALRTSRGLDLSRLDRRFGHAESEAFKTKAQRFVECGLLVCENGVYRLSQKGVMVSNAVISDLFADR